MLNHLAKLKYKVFWTGFLNQPISLLVVATKPVSNCCKPLLIAPEEDKEEMHEVPVSLKRLVAVVSPLAPAGSLEQ